MSQPGSPDAANGTGPTDRDDPAADDAATDDVQPVPLTGSGDTGAVPDKQLYRWKDDGGAVHPDS